MLSLIKTRSEKTATTTTTSTTIMTITTTWLSTIRSKKNDILWTCFQFIFGNVCNSVDCKWFAWFLGICLLLWLWLCSVVVFAAVLFVTVVVVDSVDRLWEGGAEKKKLSKCANVTDGRVILLIYVDIRWRLQKKEEVPWYGCNHLISWKTWGQVCVHVVHWLALYLNHCFEFLCHVNIRTSASPHCRSDAWNLHLLTECTAFPFEEDS